MTTTTGYQLHHPSDYIEIWVEADYDSFTQVDEYLQLLSHCAIVSDVIHWSQNSTSSLYHRRLGSLIRESWLVCLCWTWYGSNQLILTMLSILWNVISMVIRWWNILRSMKYALQWLNGSKQKMLSMAPMQLNDFGGTFLRKYQKRIRDVPADYRMSLQTSLQFFSNIGLPFIALSEYLTQSLNMCYISYSRILIRALCAHYYEHTFIWRTKGLIFH